MSNAIRSSRSSSRSASRASSPMSQQPFIPRQLQRTGDNMNLNVSDEHQQQPLQTTPDRAAGQQQQTTTTINGNPGRTNILYNSRVGDTPQNPTPGSAHASPHQPALPVRAQGLPPPLINMPNQMQASQREVDRVQSSTPTPAQNHRRLESRGYDDQDYDDPEIQSRLQPHQTSTRIPI